MTDAREIIARAAESRLKIDGFASYDEMAAHLIDALTAAGFRILSPDEVDQVREAMEPHLWQCKDYADGWIDYFNEAEALAYQRDTGCAMRITYRAIGRKA